MNKMEIPHIIHQIWVSNQKEMPTLFHDMCQTWKRDYPTWEYKLWNENDILEFLKENFPNYINIFYKFPFNVQRWDAIRYLILYKIGGMYVDIDYESLSSIEDLIKNKTCCFALEPQTHIKSHKYKHDQVFNNALMLSVPGHQFMKKIIDHVFNEKMLLHETNDKDLCVMETTGPWMLVNLYYNQTGNDRKNIYLIPSKFVTPFDFQQVSRFIEGEESPELEMCLTDAYAVHYFFGMWKNNKE